MELNNLLAQLAELKAHREELKTEVESTSKEADRYRSALGALNALYEKSEVIWLAIRELEQSSVLAKTTSNDAVKRQKENKDAITKLSATINYTEKKLNNVVELKFDVSNLGFGEIIDAVFYAHESQVAVFDIHQIEPFLKYADAVYEFEHHKPSELKFILQSERSSDLAEIVGVSEYKTKKLDSNFKVRLTLQSSKYQKLFNENIYKVRTRFFKCRTKERS